MIEITAISPQKKSFKERNSHPSTNMRPIVCVTLFFSTAKHAAHNGRHSVVLRWLLHLGGVGLFFLAVVDSSLIPVFIPGSTDLVLLLLIAHRGNPILIAGCAISGSILGGYLSWSAGKKGGEMVLKHHVSHRILQPISNWVKRRGRLSIAIAALLPPPVPLMPVLIAAGSLGVTRKRFLFAFGGGRTIRYGLLAWLASSYGRKILRAWSQYLSGWSKVLLWGYVGLLILGIGYGVWKYRKQGLTAASSS